MYKEVVHRNKIDALMTHFRAVRHQLYTSSQIRIRYHWFKYKKKKAAKKAKKAAKGKKKKTTAKAPVAPAAPVRRAGGSGTTSPVDTKRPPPGQTGSKPPPAK